MRDDRFQNIHNSAETAGACQYRSSDIRRSLRVDVYSNQYVLGKESFMEKILKVLGGYDLTVPHSERKEEGLYALTSGREEVGKTASVRRWLYG